MAWLIKRTVQQTEVIISVHLQRIKNFQLLSFLTKVVWLFWLFEGELSIVCRHNTQLWPTHSKVYGLLVELHPRHPPAYLISLAKSLRWATSTHPKVPNSTHDASTSWLHILSFATPTSLAKSLSWNTTGHPPTNVHRQTSTPASWPLWPVISWLLPLMSVLPRVSAGNLGNKWPSTHKCTQKNFTHSWPVISCLLSWDGTAAVSGLHASSMKSIGNVFTEWCVQAIS